MIDWCLEPTLAIFQRYLAFYMIDCKSYKDTATLQKKVHSSAINYFPVTLQTGTDKLDIPILDKWSLVLCVYCALSEL